ncbi:hypothetical protein RRSWK_01851 [Rhodopirellula sp. SWK7]|nr:hypothetical protein RRSWK_01851 [Rhodopirellula sp. SWK7]
MAANCLHLTRRVTTTRDYRFLSPRSTRSISFMAKPSTPTDTPTDDTNVSNESVENEGSAPEATVSDDSVSKESEKTSAETEPEKAKDAKASAKDKPSKPAKANATPSKVAAASKSSASSAKKESGARSKKTAASGKNAGLLPSDDQLESLKEAVAAAGGAENLLLILQHVEDAGGRVQVEESIEAYRVLKTVLEE